MDNITVVQYREKLQLCLECGLEGIGRWELGNGHSLIWCDKHKEEIQAQAPNDIKQRYTKAPTILIPIEDTINEIILRNRGKNVIYGAAARRLYNKDEMPEIERLHRVAPGQKYLVYSENGEFITEGRSKMAVDAYLNEHRVLVHRQ